MNIVIFNNEHIQKQTCCFTSNVEQFDFYDRVRAFFIRFSEFKNFISPPITLQAKSTSVSIIHQFFDTNDLETVHQEDLLMISLMELGNTVDGVAIASKILKDIEEPDRAFYTNFHTF